MRTKIILLLLILLLLKGSFAMANEPFSIPKDSSQYFLDSLLATENFPAWKIKLSKKLVKNSENPKLISVGLAVMLGVFGVHRLYLGTQPKVPVIYTVTFGGGFGIVTVIDIIAILSTKDISKYQNNPKVFMWLK